MPDFRLYVRQNLPPLGISGARELEIIEELAIEVQETYERAIRNGLVPEEAWAKVRERSWRELGEELRSVLEEHQPSEPEPKPAKNVFSGFCSDTWRDLRYAVRQLCNSPGFATIAILTLALGIGANTAIFSLLDAVLLRSLPVRQADQLVWFGKTSASGDTEFLPHGSTQIFSYKFFREFHQRNQVFADVAAISSVLFQTYGRTAGGRDLEKVSIELVSGSYFNTVGVNPVIGRVLGDGDDMTPGAHPVAVASYSWWQRRFAKDPSAVGRTVSVGTVVYTIVGVTTPEFSGVSVGQSPDLWIPLAMEKEISPGWNGLEDSSFQSLHMVARRKPGIGEKQTLADTNFLFRQIWREYLGPQPSHDDLEDIQHAYIELVPAATGRSELRSQFTSPLEILMVLVALVLLIACANVANLLLARATARQREFAVRMSIGAERSRLIRQLLVESGVLGIAGAALGVPLSWGAGRLLLLMVSTGPELMPLRVTPDAKVLGFSLAVTLLTVLLFGTAPAYYATGLDLVPTLKEGRGVVGSPIGRFSRGLVVTQVAFSMVLLVCAGLFLRTLANLMQVDPGFDKQNVLLTGLEPGGAGYHLDARLESMMERLEQRVGALPGVHGASFASEVLDGGGWSGNDVAVPGRPAAKHNPSVDFNLVGPEYFEAMGMPLILGRSLNARDNRAATKVAVINETMARDYFPGGSPLGRTFSVGEEADCQNVEVVGVVKDAKYMDLEEKQMPAAFYPHAQHLKNFLYNFVTRYSGDPGVVSSEIRKTVAEIDPNLPVSGFKTLAQVVDDSIVNKRVVAQLSTVFGMLAVFLACIGIYGVMSYGITRRTNEFGIRMALGADRRRVLWVVLRETLALAALGLAIGLALSLASSRVIESLLFGLKPHDPLTIGLAMLTMIAAAFVAGYVPARRATRIDPMVALRHV